MSRGPRRKWISYKGKSVVVGTHKDLPVWTLFKIFINDLKKDEIFTRKELLNFIYTVPMSSYETSVDMYRSNVTKLGFLESVERGKYKKLFDIPINVTTTKIMKIIRSKRSWKEWFIPLHDQLGVDSSVDLPEIQ